MMRFQNRFFTPLMMVVSFFVISFSISLFAGTPVFADENANRSGTDLNYHGITYYRQAKAQDGDVENWGGSNDSHTYFKENTLGSCSEIIVVNNPPDDAREGYRLKREHMAGGLGACRVKSKERITIDSGLTKKEGENKQSIDEMHEAITNKAYTVCSNARPNDINQCEKDIESAFNACVEQLGGGAGNNKYKNHFGQDQLAHCISDKTGIPYDEINKALTPVMSDETNPQCDVKGMGWLICQASKLMAKIMDGAFTVLKQLLNVPGLGLSTQGGQTMHAIWSSIRNIANVVFVMIFLFVIYSQLTGQGLDNYGIKRLLPRLIVAIILTNSSYFLCALMVDITNILGATLRDLIVTVAIPVKPEFNGWNQVASVALVGAAAVTLYLNIAVLLPVITSGFLAVLMTILLLIARQAIIIMLIILSPLAFVLNTLPNTQKWFERWWSAFFIILMMYPVISVIYGGSQVAAGVISASNPDQSTAILFAVMALGVQAVPLFTVPLIMKAGGGIFERFTGVINSPTKGVFDRVRRKSQDKADELTKAREINAVTQNKGGLHARVTKRRAKRDFASQYAKNQLKGNALKTYTGSEGVAQDIAESGALGATSMSERIPFGKRHEDAMKNKSDAVEEIKNALDQTAINAEVSGVTAEEAVLKDQNYSEKELETLFKEGVDKDGNAATEYARAAAAKELARQGKLDRIHDILRSLKEMEGGPSRSMRQAVVSGIQAGQAKNGAIHLNGTNLKAISDGSAFRQQGDVVNNLYNSAVEADLYNPNTAAQQSSQSLHGLNAALSSGAIDPTKASAVRASVSSTQSSDRLRTKMSASARREASRF